MSKIKKSPWGEGAILSPQNPLIGKARRLLAGTSEIEREGVEYVTLGQSPCYIDFNSFALNTSKAFADLVHARTSTGKEVFFGNVTVTLHATPIKGSSYQEFTVNLPKIQLAPLGAVAMRGVFNPNTDNFPGYGVIYNQAKSVYRVMYNSSADLWLINTLLEFGVLVPSTKFNQ